MPSTLAKAAPLALKLPGSTFARHPCWEEGVAGLPVVSFQGLEGYVCEDSHAAYRLQEAHPLLTGVGIREETVGLFSVEILGPKSGFHDLAIT